jgi:phosphate/sulfate permease
MAFAVVATSMATVVAGAVIGVGFLSRKAEVRRMFKWRTWPSWSPPQAN